MNTTPTPTAQTPANEQTPGPLLHSIGNTYFEKSGRTYTADLLYARDYCGAWVAAVWKDVPGGIDAQEANGRLLTVAYNLADRAGRELGIDAAALCESLDLAALIRATQEAVATLRELGAVDASEKLRGTLPAIFPAPQRQ